MTRKDYIVLANSIKKMKSLGKDNHLFVADMIAFDLGQDNPRFDRTRFIEACGISE